MSDMTVGPIQTYVGDSTLSSPTINQSPSQGNVSVTLTDSNLWLVDTSKLNGQTSDPTTQFTLMNLQTKYQTTVPFDNVNFSATTIAPAALTTSESSYLQSSLPQGNALMLASVTGGTQLGSDGMSLSASGSSGSGAGGTSSSGASGGLSGAGGGGGTGSSGGAGAGSSSSSASAGQATSTAQTGTGVNAQATVGLQAIAIPQPTGSPQAPTPVPFEASPTIGLLFVLLLFGHKLRLRKIAFQSMGIKTSA